MTLSIHGASAAALTALDSLAPQTTDPGADASSPASAGSANASVINLTSGAPTSLTGDLSDAASLADAAVAAGTTVEGLLAQLQQDAVSAADPGLSGDGRTSLNASFTSGLAQIQSAVAGASVGGVNLIDGSLGAPITAGGSVTLTPANLSLGGPLIGLDASASLSDPSTAATLADQLGAAIDSVGQAVGQIAAQGQAINGHLTVVAQAAASLSPSLAGAINGDLDGEGASLQALQVQQQLQSSGGSIANQSPLAILALFR
jgi:flagellin-like hook-associated protein FlgL